MIMCKNCKRFLTWEDAKRQYGRLKKKNIVETEIKEILPRCSKCITRWLKGKTV